MQEDFEAAAERIKPVTGPNNDEMLELYALFKQANAGDNTTRTCTARMCCWSMLGSHLTCVMCVDAAKPGMLDLKGKKKWDAWNGKKGNVPARMQQLPGISGQLVRCCAVTVASNCRRPVPRLFLPHTHPIIFLRRHELGECYESVYRVSSRRQLAH